VKIFSYSINSSVYYGFHSFLIYGLQPAVKSLQSALVNHRNCNRQVAEVLFSVYFCRTTI